MPVRVQARVPVQGRELKANLGQQQEPPQPEQWPEALQQERQMEQEELQLEFHCNLRSMWESPPLSSYCHQSWPLSHTRLAYTHVSSIKLTI